MADDKKEKPFLWTYVGRRFVKGSAVKQCFVQSDDPETIR